MSSEWKEMTLGDVTQWHSGGTPKKDVAKYWNGDIPWISANSMHGTRFYDSELKITSDGLNNGSRLASKDSVLLLVRGGALHNRLPVGIAMRDVAFNQDVKSLVADPKILSSWYLLYWLVGNERYLLDSIVEETGIGAGKLDTKRMQSLPIRIPTISTQNQIVKVFKSIDDKIELNRQANQTLEQIAQALFKSWFVDFEPTRAKIAAKEAGASPKEIERAAMCAISGKTPDQLTQLPPETQQNLKTTAALFPDALVDSALGNVPEGWEVKEVKQLAEKISKGTTPTKSDEATARDEKTIPFLKVRDISDLGEVSRTDLDKISESVHTGSLKRSILLTNDLLFSIAGTIGRVALVEEDLNNSNCNQALAYIRLKETDKHLELCRLYLRSPMIQEEVASKVVQGVQANFSLTALGEIKLLILNNVLLEVFEVQVGTLCKQQRILSAQSRRLAEMRDTLLPKLLSGEIEVSNVD
ncbi:restriction endonuclease subunit S [Undibacterium sp. FT147W]|uniref:Restriction endonuclease subunit S n=1 Tax=Undibacterium rivi TaxID=2828729 RepID=A0ABS5H4X0_9BURK|nr:restriction endonuclease subunit S [Undibacterium rivi]MBR7793572.1 restriction endonuclease subunit S [Undibacterium rivi]